MPRKTNKTSHVLNLITNGASVETEETSENQEEAVIENQPAPAEVREPEAEKKTEDKEAAPRLASSGDKTVIVVDETSKSQQISSQILDRLTDQLEEDLQEKPIHYHMVNVMEQILRRMNLCSRCQADVLALILTRLPAKYVVVDESSTAPIIGFYESKFRVRILTEIIKACIDVKDHPRHDNSGPYDG